MVIGGGFTGTAAALAAAESGARVILLEAETIGFGASGRNGGQLIPGLRWSARELIAAFGLERARAIHALAMAAVERVKARIAGHAIDCDLAAGHLEAAHKPAHFAAMREEVELLTDKFGRTGLELVAAAAKFRGSSPPMLTTAASTTATAGISIRSIMSSAWPRRRSAPARRCTSTAASPRSPTTARRSASPPQPAR